MPKVSLAPENKVNVSSEFPKFTLDFKETALIIAIEEQPTAEYKHMLRVPSIGNDGKVIKGTRTNNKGEEYEVTEYDFIGQHLCFGDFGTLEDKGVDPTNCPTCAASIEEDCVDAPVKYFAMNIIKYATDPGKFTVRDPFSASCEAWVFSATRFNELIELATEWEDLRQHDLKIGPCENKKFQKYKIDVSKNAQWLTDEARKQLVAEVYKKNQCPDLSTMIARRVDKTKALEDIQKTIEGYAKAYGTPSSSLPDLTPAVTVNAASAAAVATESDDEPPFTPDPPKSESDGPKVLDLSSIINDL